MMINKKFNIFIIEILLFKLCHNKVIFVYEIFRHGTRSPSVLDKYDKDIFSEQWDGIQELTNSGLRQHYLLGNYIRNKYPDLINYENYNPKDIEIITTSKNRTIMSARAQLNGIFSNSKIKNINQNQINTCKPYYLINEINNININDISFYPDEFEEIPVHFYNNEEKLDYFEESYICPLIDELKLKNINRKEFNNFAQKFNQTFGEYLLKYYNISNDKDYFISFYHVNSLCASAISNIFEARKIKLFNDQEKLDLFYNYSKEFMDLKMIYYYANDETNVLAYAGSSILLRKILSYMEKIINDINNNINDSPKLVLFSSHDSSIANLEGLINCLFKAEILPPNYSSSYIFELNKKEEKNEYYVNIIFNNKLVKTIDYTYFKSKIERDSWTFEKTAAICGWDTKNESNTIDIDNIKNRNNIWLIIIVISSEINSLLILVIFILLGRFNQINKSKDIIK